MYLGAIQLIFFLNLKLMKAQHNGPQRISSMTPHKTIFSDLTFPSTVPLKFFLPFALFFFRRWHLTVTTTTQVKQKQDNQVHK